MDIAERVFHDGLMRLRTNQGPANVATVRHMALNLLRSVLGEHSMAVERKSAGRDETFLFNTIT